MFLVSIPSFHTSHCQFTAISTSHIATFHYKTWRTIVNIRFHRIYQIKLHNLKTSYSSSHIKLNQQLPFRVVDNHVVRTPFSRPHIQRWFDYGLTLTGSRTFVIIQFFICTSMSLQHTPSITFCQWFCTIIARQRRLVDRLYSVLSQIQVHYLCVAVDQPFTISLHHRIFVTNEVPDLFSTHNP